MSQNPLTENKMGTMPVGKLLVNMALPMIISMMVQALYNVVDSIYISQISESAVTSLSLAFPVQNLQIGFAVGIGSLMNFCMNQILQGFSETATSVFGIYFKIQSFFFMPLFGINGATISIVAFNYGARKPERIMKTLKLACGAALVLMVTGLIVFQLLPDVLLGMFNPTEEFLAMGRVALRTISWSFPVAAVCIALGASFQALGDGIYSTITSLCRQLLVLLPVAYLLSLSGDVNKVWIAYPAAEIVSGALTCFFFLRIYRRKIKPLCN